MLINADVKGLEVSGAAYLSQDPVLMQELLDGVDIHGENQAKFGLPTRLIAKTLVFRILYGGTEFSFAQDPTFTPVSAKTSFWKSTIEKFYDKYKGIHDWHTRLVNDVVLTGKYTSPTGREYNFKPYTNERGDIKWPRTNILNYPVQGFGADLMAITRVSFANRIKRKEMYDVKLLATVHDSLLVDVPDDQIDQVVTIINEVARDVPMNFFKLFGVSYVLPYEVEIEIGNNYLQMEKYKC